MFQLYTEYELEEDSLKEALTSLHKYVCEDLDFNKIKIKQVMYNWDLEAPIKGVSVSACKEDMEKSLQLIGEAAEVAETGDWRKMRGITYADLMKQKLEEENAAAKQKPEEENAAAAKPKRVRKNKKDKEDPK
jgi:hypothetical protein